MIYELILLFGTPIALYKAETNITKRKNKKQDYEKVHYFCHHGNGSCCIK